MQVVFCLFGMFLVSIHCSDRNVELRVNPGCTSNCDDFNLLYIRGTNGSVYTDTIVAASNMFGTPSILMLSRSVGSESIPMNYTSRSFENISDVTQSYGLSFLNLVEYNDIHDVVNMSTIPLDSSVSHNMSDFNWTLTASSNQSKDKPYKLNESEIYTAVFAGLGTDPMFSAGGRVELKISVSESHQSNPAMPRLQFIPGLTIQVELALINLQSNFSNARFGLQMVPISNDTVAADEQYHPEIFYSIFDEVTPGTFKTVNILLAERMNRYTGRCPSPQPPSEIAGFVQMKPVSYTHADERNVKSSRDVLIDSYEGVLNDVEKSKLQQSIITAFYGDRNIGYRIQNVSFGTQGDEFYPHSNYLVWSLSFGLGSPPIDSPSTLLLGLVGVAGVIAAASIIIGTVVICSMRRNSNNVEFQPLIQSSVDT